MANFYAFYPPSSGGSGSNASVGPTGDPVPSSATYIAGIDGGGDLIGVLVDASGHLQVEVTGSVIPTGAATEATLLNVLTETSDTATNTADIVTNTASIDTKIPTVGQKAMAASMPVVIASDQSAVAVSGSVTVSGTVAATQSGTWTVQPGNTANTTPWLATINQGGNSATVTGANALKVDGSASTQPVSGTVTADAGTGTFTTDQVASTTATFQDGSIAFGSLTTNYQTVITAGGALKNVCVRNNTNAVIVVSLNSGASDSITLDSGDFVSWDLKPLGLNIPSTTTLQAKYTGSAPTSGSIRINGVY